MVKKTILATTFILLCSASPADAQQDQMPLAQFVSQHGPEVMLQGDAETIRFAGRFASAAATPETELAALAFLEQWSDLFRIDPLTNLGPPTVTELSGLSYVRFDQTHEGIAVEGADVVVTVSDAGLVHQVSSGYRQLTGFASAEPAMSDLDAVEIVTGEMDELTYTGQSRLVYLPAPDGISPLAWVVRFRSHGGPEMPEVYVDAHTGRILWARDTNIYYQQAWVYDPNPSTAPDLLTVTLPNLTSDANLVGTYARAWKCLPGSGWDMCPDRERLATPDGSGDYFFTPEEGVTNDPFAEVMAYYHMDRINTHMEDAYGHAYSCDGHRWMDVHVNMDYENAWYGDQNDDGCPDVTIGQGAQDYAWDSAIVYHEFGHGVNHSLNRISGWAFDILGPDHSPQGVDEAMADYWAASFIGRPVIGEYAGMGTPGELGIRDVSEFASCPDDIYGEGHYDSPMLSSTMWDIRSDIGQEKADRLGLALLSSTSREVDFDEAGRALISQASALESSGVLTSVDVTAVEDAVDAHTLVGCERILPMEDDDSHIFLATGYGGADVPSGVQFSIYSPPTATRVTAIFSQLSMGGGYTVYVNRDSPVAFSLSGWSISIDDWDYRFDASPERVTFTEWSDPPIEQDTTYYFTYVHNSQTMALGVEVIVVAPEPEDTSVDVVVDPTLDPEEDTAVADVPEEIEEDAPLDVVEDTTTVPDAETDTNDPSGQIKSDAGCGCSLVR